jgi:hypothetical protein
MTAPQLSRICLDPVAAAWLAGGADRALDTLLIARLERRRIAIVDGNVVDRGLDRVDPLDGALLDALGARGSRDLETVRWRVSRDRRFDRVRVDLVAAGLLGERTRRGSPTRPARTASGRRLLRELPTAAHAGAAWEIALQGRAGLTDLALREALEPVRPAIVVPRRRPWTRASLEDRHLHASGMSTAAAVGGWGAFGGGGVDCGGGFGGGGDGGGC